jgi:hypothetical protein
MHLILCFVRLFVRNAFKHIQKRLKKSFKTDPETRGTKYCLTISFLCSSFSRSAQSCLAFKSIRLFLYFSYSPGVFKFLSRNPKFLYGCFLAFFSNLFAIKTLYNVANNKNTRKLLRNIPMFVCASNLKINNFLNKIVIQLIFRFSYVTVTAPLPFLTNRY